MPWFEKVFFFPFHCQKKKFFLMTRSGNLEEIIYKGGGCFKMPCLIVLGDDKVFSMSIVSVEQVTASVYEDPSYLQANLVTAAIETTHSWDGN